MITPTYSWNQEGLPENQYRYRTDWRGKLILQVGVATRLYSAQMEEYLSKYEWQWRDAKVSDLTGGVVK